MDRFESLALKMGFGLMVVFFVALVGLAVLKGIDVPTCFTDFPPFKEGKVIQKGEKEYEVHLLAKMWVFQPTRIEIPAGSKVTIYTTSIDVLHGFHIEGKAVNLMSIPGAVNKMEVVFNKPGTYKIICNEYCGVGHPVMYGEIIVK
jgi:Heme/copper-type cytochrome/quinol oxidases, subunit 2